MGGHTRYGAWGVGSTLYGASRAAADAGVGRAYISIRISNFMSGHPERCMPLIFGKESCGCTSFSGYGVRGRESPGDLTDGELRNEEKSVALCDFFFLVLFLLGKDRYRANGVPSYLERNILLS